MTPEFFSHQKLEVELHPGEKCPSCERRIPYPKKSDSPKTRVSSYRVPVDDSETHEEMLIAWAKHWGLYGKPHWKFWLLTYAGAEGLAGPPRNLAA